MIDDQAAGRDAALARVEADAECRAVGGIFQIGIAYALVTVGLRRVPALQASLLLLIETALNPVWTWALLGEVPTSYALAGGALIVAGTIVQSRPAPHAAVEVTPG